MGPNNLKVLEPLRVLCDLPSKVLPPGVDPEAKNKLVAGWPSDATLDVP